MLVETVYKSNNLNKFWSSLLFKRHSVVSENRLTILPDNISNEYADVGL